MKRLIYFFGLIVLLTSCKGTKTVIGSNTADANLSYKNIVGAHNAAEPSFNTLASRVKVVYEDEKQRQSVTVSLRMEKDKKIWIKASILGITLAKALITPEQVRYYETLGNTYFDGDFRLLSEWLGTELDFEKAQAILLGQSIIPLGSPEYQSSIAGNKYKIAPKNQPSNFIHSILLNPDNFKVHSGKVSQPADDRQLNLTYSEYQVIEQQIFPVSISIRAREDTKPTNIDVTYRNIDINVSLSFPFTIPQGYEEIELSK